MPRFFVDDEIHDEYLLTGENARHAIKSLRLRVGEEVTLCNGSSMDYLAKVKEIESENLLLDVVDEKQNEAESAVKVVLYQCLPKSDKMDWIVQKAVELGVNEIVPVVSSRCIASFSGKEEKKIARLQKISLEAAKQSGRGIIPKISSLQKFQDVMKNAKGTKIFFYEKYGQHLSEILFNKTKEKESVISILIGSEGGFSEEEAKIAKENGFSFASLGKRILRTETAGLCALSIIMYEFDR